MLWTVILVNSLNYGVFSKQATISMLVRWKPNIIPTMNDKSLFTLSEQHFHSYIKSRILLEEHNSFGIVCLTDDSLMCMFVCRVCSNFDIIHTSLWHPNIVNKHEIILFVQHKYFSEYSKKLLFDHRG